MFLVKSNSQLAGLWLSNTTFIGKGQAKCLSMGSPETHSDTKIPVQVVYLRVDPRK